jgi:hypothetical protein
MSSDQSYNPAMPPSSEAWLNLSEQRRHDLVATFHRVNQLKSGDANLHAAMHVIVENQIAMGFNPTLRAMERLQTQGLSRHDAVHAIGSVLAGLLFTSIRNPGENDSRALEARISVALESLDADTWREEYGE